MNQKQRDYLIKRVDAIYDIKKSAVYSEASKLPKEKVYILRHLVWNKDASIAKQFKNEFVEQIEKYSYGRSSQNFSIVDFSNYDNVNKEYARLMSIESRLKDEKVSALARKTTEIKDQIVFAQSYDDCLKFIRQMEKL